MSTLEAISLNEFRRRFFSGKNRPTKAAVVSWIENGTNEGRRLRAFLIDGRYYIRLTDAADFLRPSEPTKSAPPSHKLRTQRNRIAAAKSALSTKYGFRF